MKEVEIRLSLPEDIKEFVKVTMKYPFDIDLLSGRYVVDGKSILGIFSLDLKEPIKVRMHCDDCDSLIQELEPYKL
jgi:phosphotransferase system HPr-like phosphotransfer protein